MSIDEIPVKSLDVQVNVFSSKPNVAQHNDCKQYADIACYGLYSKIKTQNKIYVP